MKSQTNNRKHFLFHFGHPAHFQLFKNIIKNLNISGHRISIVIKKKDILELLLENEGFEYVNLLPKGRPDSKFGIFIGMIKTDYNLLKFCLKVQPDLMVGTSYAISHIGKLLKIPSINVNEDDCDVVPFYSKFSYPWASIIISPSSCKNGKWEYKSIKYSGYHELAYLHPEWFKPDITVVSSYVDTTKPYFLIRFAKLSAHHDTGIKGINYQIANRIIEILEPYGRIYISSERPLEPEFEKYRLNINPLDIHHLMAYSQMFIGDSQTMAAEAGVLGTPFIRFNDFVGRIGYLAELEDYYKLGFGIKTNEENKLYAIIKTLLDTVDLKSEWQIRRDKMLHECIDVTSFFSWFIENYPNSLIIMKDNPSYANSFNPNELSPKSI